MKAKKSISTSASGASALPPSIFWLSLACSAATAAVLIALWLRASPAPIDLTEQMRLPWDEMARNFRWMFRGYKSGYWRTAAGYLTFGAMAAAFVSFGRWITLLFFARFAGGLKDLGVGLLERCSLYYLIGSLAVSLFWFALGQTGFLKPGAAWTLAALGISALILQFQGSGAGRSVRESLARLRSDWTAAEKGWALCLFTLLVVVSSTAFLQPKYSDPNLTHFALPGYYIQWNHVAPNPYHFHSYYPQNTEMLVMWGLLLGSEFACGLLVWGFMAAGAGFLFGFGGRHAGRFAGLLTVCALFSAPVVLQLVVQVKNDIPMMVFALVHYCALVEAWNAKSWDAGNAARGWALVSGTLCAGSLGHKLSGLPMAAVSTFAVAAADLAWKRRCGWLLPWWLGGFSAVLPWMARNFWLTRNPIYPLLNEVLHGQKVKEWHSNLLYATLSLRDYWKGVWIGNNVSDPSWGAVIFLGLPGLAAVARKSVPPGFRIALLAALGTYAVMLSFALGIPGDPRYHIGLVAFIVCSGFLLGLKDAGARAGRWTRPAVAAILAFCFLAVHRVTGSGTLLAYAVAATLRGYSPGNYFTNSLDNDVEDNAKWMYHLVNRNSASEDRVLIAGIPVNYGIRRKLYFSFIDDRDVLLDVAKVCADADALGRELERMGVRHILMRSNYGDWFRTQSRPQFRAGAEVLAKIDQWMRSRAAQRLVSPSGAIHWYTVGTAGELPPITYDRLDAQEYPYMYFQQVSASLNPESAGEVERLIVQTLDLPIAKRERFFSIYLLAFAYAMQDKLDLAERTVLSLLSLAPDEPLSTLCIAEFYETTGQTEKAAEYAAQTLKNGGRKLLQSHAKLAKYLSS